MAMPSRLPSTTASARSRPLPFGTRCRGKRRSARVDVGELLERAGSEVANIVNMVVLQQSRDAAALFRRHRNLQQHVTGSERLVVDLQGYFVPVDAAGGTLGQQPGDHKTRELCHPPVVHEGFIA